ncbi:M23 family metallopeptidase [Natrononativus amylolyticus]|uniref:M23 family metallopeptidase n=1 Tax=Natrononativus amylolyticus TaxID=2963434 RepID=UPI0020CC9E82|nr:M23 family metallopeptidase [Natrononativus amylolyticus]
MTQTSLIFDEEVPDPASQYFHPLTTDADGGDSVPASFERVFSSADTELDVDLDHARRREDAEECLRLRRHGAGTTGLHWTDVPATESIELFSVWRSEQDSPAVNRLKSLALISDDEGAAILGGMADDARGTIAQFDSDRTDLDRSDEGAIRPRTAIAHRFRVVDDAAWLKIWEWGDREPREWTLGPVPVDLEHAGGVGLLAPGAPDDETEIVVWELGAVTDCCESHHWAPTRDPELDFMSYPEELTHPLPVDDHDIWYPDGWDETRDGGSRIHRAVDAYEDWPDPVTGAKVYAARSGTIRDWMAGHPDSSGGTPITPGSGGGYQIHIDSPDGKYRYCYLHLGNDEAGAHEDAFAPHPEEDRTLGPGDTVERGQHIGWLGESGVTGSGPHLHFEIRDLSGALTDDQPSDFDDLGNTMGPRYDPYPPLKDAERRRDVPG